MAPFLNQGGENLASSIGPLRGGERAWYIMFAHASSSLCKNYYSNTWISILKMETE